MSEPRPHLDRARADLAAASMPDETREHLHGLLDRAAEVSNGTPDKVGAIADALAALLVHQVRRDIRAPGEVRAAILASVEAHVVACPLRARNLTGRWAALYPYRWPLVVAAGFVLASPHAPAVLDLVRDLLK